MAEDTPRGRRDDRRSPGDGAGRPRGGSGDARRSGGPRDGRRSGGSGGGRSGQDRRDRSSEGFRGGRSGDGPRRERSSDGFRRDRSSDGPRGERSGDGPRGPRAGGDRRQSGAGSSRGGFEGRRGGERREGAGGERRDRRSASSSPRWEGRGQDRTEGTERRERPAHNPRDLRAANREDQERSPDIDADVTGQELDRGTLKEVNGLDERPASWVAKHLVMAGRYIDVDPALAFQHALAASRKGGRLSRVREAVALTAYAAGEYADALREFRTYRRMTGDDTHVAAQVDSERALGRPEKALQLAAEIDSARLDRAARVELAMVVSGIREDAGDLQGAHDALQIPELDRRRGYPFSPRLFQRQADVLLLLGRADEARLWARAVRVAEKALGIGGFAEPEIVDVDTEPVDDRRERGPSPRERRYAENAAAAEGAGSDAGTSSDAAESAEAPTADDDAASAEDAPEAPAAEEAPEAPDAPVAEDEVTADADTEAPASTESEEDAPPAAVAQADEVDPNQMSLFDELDEGEGR